MSARTGPWTARSAKHSADKLVQKIQADGDNDFKGFLTNQLARHTLTKSGADGIGF
jgi:hypothetical protein